MVALLGGYAAIAFQHGPWRPLARLKGSPGRRGEGRLWNSVSTNDR